MYSMCLYIGTVRVYKPVLRLHNTVLADFCHNFVSPLLYVFMDPIVGYV